MATDDDAFETYPIPSFTLHSGQALDASAFLAYRTDGRLSADASNAILWVTCYNQRTAEMRPMIGPGRRFDPEATGHCLITVNMPGNGVSWSASSAGSAWPKGGLHYHDCARAVHLLVGSLGVRRLALIYGFSMGAMFALEYCVQFPSAVASAVVVCGSARCNAANDFFLRTLHDSLRTDPEAEVDDDGEIRGFGGNARPDGLLEFASIYADWCPSPLPLPACTRLVLLLLTFCRAVQGVRRTPPGRPFPRQHAARLRTLQIQALLFGGPLPGAVRRCSSTAAFACFGRLTDRCG